MCLLDSSVPLPVRPRRVLVAGTSGSGKTTLAARIGEILDLPHVEIDGLHHGPNWTPRPSFREDVEEFTAQPRWVTEWQYTAVRPLLVERADLPVVRLASRREVDAWAALLASRPPTGEFDTDG
ncbi:MAG: hypothetical protein ACI38R_12335, partial [Rhodococcus sp. (in: high G+C Gram-positive bacteria)]|uniref:hypothetical protein n=1 Tax=Rhodococcus TaxID=1827 RepID=UPI00132B88B0|nr:MULTISPECIES: hypothetical protein [Rhodococcus]MXQ78890.1 hypothetical protein [Rhodococcus rhodochrous]BDB58718.1 hypothetical protein RDE2_05120 [Rhodococcus sp. RDE2]